MHLEQFSDRFLNGFLYEFGFGGVCGSGGKVMHLEQFSHRFLNGFLYELVLGGMCGSGGEVVHLEQFSDRFLNVILNELGFGGGVRKWWKSGASGAVFSSVFERILI